MPLPRSRCLVTLNSSGNLANSTSFTNLSFISASKQYVSSVLRTVVKSRLNTLLDTALTPLLCLILLKLLEKKKRVQLKDMGEDLECLCQIMRTVGPRLDHEKAKVRAPAFDGILTDWTSQLNENQFVGQLLMQLQAEGKTKAFSVTVSTI